MRFLPGPLDGLGIWGKYTFADSSIEVGPGTTSRLLGLARKTFAGSIYYFKSGFGWRIEYRFRDSFQDKLGANPYQTEFNAAEEIVDFQASYKFQLGSRLEGLKVLFQAKNLTNEPYRTFFASPEARGQYEEFGRRFWLGLSYEL